MLHQRRARARVRSMNISVQLWPSHAFTWVKSSSTTRRAIASPIGSSSASGDRTHKPRLLAVWGRNDPFFLPAGAEAFRRDIPDARTFLDTGHFALETHAAEVATAIREFLG